MGFPRRTACLHRFWNLNLYSDASSLALWSKHRSLRESLQKPGLARLNSVFATEQEHRSFICNPAKVFKSAWPMQDITCSVKPLCPLTDSICMETDWKRSPHSAELHSSSPMEAFSCMCRSNWTTEVPLLHWSFSLWEMIRMFVIESCFWARWTEPSVSHTTWLVAHAAEDDSFLLLQPLETALC